MWPESYAGVTGGGEGGVPYRVMRWMADVLYRRSDAIIVLAEANRGLVAARGGDPQKISYIPNGVSLSGWSKRAADLEPRTGAVRFIYTGAHGPANGLDVVVRACAVLERDGVDGIEVILVGEGPAKSSSFPWSSNWVYEISSYANQSQRAKYPNCWEPPMSDS